MRGMYDRDGNIAYAGKPRASRRWRSSQYRAPAERRTASTKLTLDDKASMVDAAIARGARLRYRD
jgi:hypothetical protein